MGQRKALLLRPQTVLAKRNLRDLSRRTIVAALLPGFGWLEILRPGLSLVRRTPRVLSGMTDSVGSGIRVRLGNRGGDIEH